MENNRIEIALTTSLKNYFATQKTLLEQSKSLKKKCFDELDKIKDYFINNSDQYLDFESNRINRLKKLILECNDLFALFVMEAQKEYDYRDGRPQKIAKKYSQCLYYIHLIDNNCALDDLPDEQIETVNDGCVAGSIQEHFGRSCYVFGTENNIEKKFTGHQGQNIFGIQNNCGIACVTQILILAGLSVTENDVTRVAISEGLCSISEANMKLNGATSSFQRQMLMEKFKIKSKIVKTNLFEIASYVEHGHGVISSVNAGLLWNKTDDWGTGHAVMVYGTIHETDSGKLVGFVVCDTGSGDMKRVISIGDFAKMIYFERGVNITLGAIR